MPNALEYIHSAAEKAGRYDRQRTTAASGSTSSLVCSAYAKSSWGATMFGDWWVLIESGACAGQVGLVATAGLTKATGALAFADAYTDPIASGVYFSLYTPDRLPPLRAGGRPGWLQMLNQALERTWTEDTISFTAVTGQIHYTVDTTAYPWWTDDTRIIEIQYPTTAADDVPRILPRDSWTWVSDGETRRLRFEDAPFKTGDTFTVKVNRPGNSRLKLNAALRANLSTGAVASVTVDVGGYYSATPTVTAVGGGGSGATFTAVLSSGLLTSVTVGGSPVGGSGYTSTPTMLVTRNASDTGWADQTAQTAGLATLTDEALPDVRIVRALMLALCYEEMAEQGQPGQTVQEWLAKASQWEDRAVKLRGSRAPRDANAGVLRLTSSVLGSSPSRSKSRWY